MALLKSLHLRKFQKSSGWKSLGLYTSNKWWNEKLAKKGGCRDRCQEGLKKLHKPLSAWPCLQISEAWEPLNFRKNALGARKGHSRSSGRVPGYSRSSSRNSKFHSRNTRFHSRNGIPRLEQYENQNSRSHSRSDSRNWWEPTWKISFAPAFSERFFKNWGGPRAPENSLWKNWEKLNRGVSKPGCFPLFSGQVQIVSRTLSGLFLVGALNRPRKRKRTNRENPRTIPEQIGEIPGKVPKGQKRTKKEGQVQIGKPPRLKHPRLVALEKTVWNEANGIATLGHLFGCGARSSPTTGAKTHSTCLYSTGGHAPILPLPPKTSIVLPKNSQSLEVKESYSTCRKRGTQKGVGHFFSVSVTFW